ncbi:MAG: MFS transporter [Ruminococcaceae bacterium]|nr:MFS transporter [Oscillospiraceae bacterium]
MKLRLPRISNPFAALYAEARLTKEIQRSLYFILLSNICGNLFCQVGGSGTTAMIQLSNFLGAGDFEYGLITGIPLAAAILQIPFSVLVTRTQKRKKYILTYGLFSRALWLLFGLVPFFVPADPEWLRLWTVIFLLGISSCCGGFINVCWAPWMADLMPIGIRGRWISRRDAINSVMNVAMGLFIAWILDVIGGPIKYTIVFLIGGAFGVFDMLAFIGVKEVYSTPPQRTSIMKSMKRVMRDKPFLQFSIFWAAWCFTANMSGMYISRYCMNEMGMSNMGVTIFGSITASLITVLVISRWGRFLDHYGCKPVMLVSGIVASLTQGFILFMYPGASWPMFLHNFIGAAFWSASNLAATTMQLSYSPDDERPAYLAFFSCITSLLGSFAGTMVGGAALDWMAAIGIPGNVGFDRYKILIVVAVVLRFLTVILLVPRMDNDREGTVGDMFRDFGNVLRAIPARVRLLRAIAKSRRSL